MDTMKKVLVDQDRVRHKLAFWKNQSTELSTASPLDGEQELRPGATLTEEQIHALIQRSFDEQRAELSSVLAEQRDEFREQLGSSIRDHLAEVSAPVERLYQASLQTQQQLLRCSQELREEVTRFADDLSPRVEKIESTAHGLGSTVEKLERATQTYVERFHEQIGELTDNLETTNHSLFALHKSTGARIDDVLETHKADFDSLWRQQPEARDDTPAGLHRIGVFCSDRWRAARTYIHRTALRLVGPRQAPAGNHPGLPHS